MKIYRIKISSWTASFKYPTLISGYQPTLPVPPFSTVNGLISAAKGSYFIPKKEKIGFIFLYEGKAIDLETIYQIPFAKKRDVKSNVIKREFLFETQLFLYTDSDNIIKWMQKPQYSLLLGRTSDLAKIDEIEEFETMEKESLRLIGTIIPLKKGLVPGIIQALPKYFSNTLPRRNIGTEPYTILDCKKGFVNLENSKGFFDKEYNWDVYWQEY